ncbi:MAG: hypothetical protein II168_09055, partial [Ruminococcus sp.]|nr:hypothetical protein [Ruminococcus sp.]
LAGAAMLCPAKIQTQEKLKEFSFSLTKASRYFFNKGHRPVIQARLGVSRLGFRWGIHSHHRKTKMIAA